MDYSVPFDLSDYTYGHYLILYYAIDNDGTVMLCEDVNTNIPFNDFLKLKRKERAEIVKESKFEYCNCFKPCYWNPTYFVKHPIRNFLYKYRFI